MPVKTVTTVRTRTVRKGTKEARARWRKVGAGMAAVITAAAIHHGLYVGRVTSHGPAWCIVASGR